MVHGQSKSPVKPRQICTLPTFQFPDTSPNKNILFLFRNVYPKPDPDKRLKASSEKVQQRLKTFILSMAPAFC